MRTRVKICGLTTVEDALDASRCGADAIGLVFYARSPRAVTVETARRIVDGLPPFVTVVPLFMDPEADLVHEVLGAMPVDLLQFHGDESPAFCAQFGRRYLKAIPMGGGTDPTAYARDHAQAAGFLLDSHAPGERGGSGKVFNWELIPAALGRPVVLAGGLNPDNVADAVARFRPWGVDVSSGVEASPGRKDSDRISHFISEVDRVQL